MRSVHTKHNSQKVPVGNYFLCLVYIRIKLQDDPLPPPLDEGLVHFIIDYQDISHDVYVSGDGNKEERKKFDYFTLTVDWNSSPTCG